jgi:hypothetical protein
MLKEDLRVWTIPGVLPYDERATRSIISDSLPIPTIAGDVGYEDRHPRGVPQQDTIRADPLGVNSFHAKSQAFPSNNRPGLTV